MLKCGVDRAEDFADLFAGRVALVTSPTGVTSQGEATAQLLRRICNLKLLLAPEHGIRGNRAAGEEFGGETDPETRLEVMSLYSGASKHLPEAAILGADTFVYDIQDVGCRYYTFISTLKNMLEDCAKYGKRLIVLDRPNPLGDRTEGSVLQPEMISFVGCHEIPVCYGLTCGEFAGMLNAQAGFPCDLHVIPCTGWDRTETFSRWGTDWIRPSPNLPNFEAALLYPGTCLIEGTNLSEGRGTVAPFATIGAPFVDGTLLCRELEERNCPGITVEPIRFTPAASKHQGIPCGGIRLHVTDETQLESTALGIHLLDILRSLYPKETELLPGAKEIPFLSWLAGHREFEKANWNASDLIDSARKQAADFYIKKQAYHLYGKKGQYVHPWH